jgi:hypothetical protein
MRMSYRDAIDWIALNGKAGADDTEHDIACDITTCLVAD